MGKSHPVKKRARFRCRNTGCTELLVNESSRSRHERNSCPLKLNSKQALSTDEKAEFLTPTRPFKRRRAAPSSSLQNSASFSTTASVTCHSSEMSSKISVCSETSSDEAVELHHIGIVFVFLHKVKIFVLHRWSWRCRIPV